MWPHPDTLQGISDHQREQFALATSRRVGCLSGGPGTGKTHTLASILAGIDHTNEMLRAMQGEDSETRHYIPGIDRSIRSVAICAPTGKAAVRATQMLHRHADRWGLPELNSYFATTIHTLLQPTRNGHDEDGWGFEFDAENPLGVTHVIVEESSMLDVDACSWLLSALQPGTHVLFVGDPFQLPPVGHGRPFLDMIESGLPHGHLTEIHRFAGRIAKVCDALRHRQPWAPSEKLDLEAESPENLRHINVQGEAEILKAVIEMVSRAEARGYDPRNDVQVICAVNDKSTLSRSALNKVLRKILNPKAGMSGLRWDEEDKIVCLRNMWLPSAVAMHKGDESVVSADQYISNGDVGEVIHVNPDAKRGRTVIANFTGREVVVPRAMWDEFDHAYALTCHKMQGSQVPVAIVVADPYAGANHACSSAWWYTAVSRASDYTIVVGPKWVIDRHCLQVGIEARRTLLKQRIKRIMQEAEKSHVA